MGGMVMDGHRKISPDWLRAVAAAEMSTWLPVPACLMLADATEIADSAARADVESECMIADEDGRWFDLASYSPAPGSADLLTQSLRYLTARGLIERHPDHSGGGVLA